MTCAWLLQVENILIVLVKFQTCMSLVLCPGIIQLVEAYAAACSPYPTNIIYLFTAIGFLPGGSGYFTCKQNMKLVTNKFKSGGLHEKHVVATWNVGNRLSICL